MMQQEFMQVKVHVTLFSEKRQGHLLAGMFNMINTVYGLSLGLLVKAFKVNF